MHQVVTRENSQFLSKYYKHKFVGNTRIRSFDTPNFGKFRTFFAKMWTQEEKMCIIIISLEKIMMMGNMRELTNIDFFSPPIKPTKSIMCPRFGNKCSKFIKIWCAEAPYLCDSNKSIFVIFGQKLTIFTCHYLVHQML